MQLQTSETSRNIVGRMQRIEKKSNVFNIIILALKRKCALYKCP